jgi:signal transduction histidine kinase
MTTLIHDLVEVVALEAGTRVLHLERVDVGAALRSASEMYAGLAAEQGVALWVDVPPEVPDVRADRARLLQILSNLVGNAVKFTPAGGSVRLSAEAAGESVRFCVIDTGRGIDPEHLPRLFERFWQARRGDRQGLGLGLSIAKAVVDAHGGRIWAESTPGAGSTFSFTLPAVAGEG